MFAMISSCMQGIKLEFNQFNRIWERYKYIWEVDRDDTIAAFIKQKPVLKNFEDELQKYNMARSQLGTERTEYRYGSILIDCVSLRDTIHEEIKQWLSIYGKAMQIKYKREMDFIVAQVQFLDKVLRIR